MPDSITQVGKHSWTQAGSLRVLVVDDGENAAEILAMFFRLEGMETEVATDGLNAVEVARHFDPQLVCMDLGMPRMDGFEAAMRLRAWKPETVLVALSGSNAEEDLRRSTASGFDLHLVKPVTPDDLREVIDRYFPGLRTCGGVTHSLDGQDR